MQQITYTCMTVFVFCLVKEVHRILISTTAIKVIRIYSQESLSLESLSCAPKGMCGPPWFISFFRKLYVTRIITQRLINICYLYLFADPVTNSFLKLLFKISADNKYNFRKACLDSIINRIVYEYMLIFIYRFYLL